jgi:hypothetical protein
MGAWGAHHARRTGLPQVRVSNLRELLCYVPRAMRGILALVLLVSGCENSKKAAIEEAQKQQEAEASKRGAVTAAKKITPPVAGEAKLPCDQVVHLEKYQAALEEKEPLSIKDVTAKKGDITSDCNLVRGGKKLTDAEQKKLLKDTGRLGILSGDVVCNFKLICSKFDDLERFKKRCAAAKERADESMGTFACVQVVPTGVHDVEVFKFFDEDTKCNIEVRGGPSNTDNNVIRTCAKVARDTIGPDQIKPGAPKLTPADAGSGSDSAGSGS